MLLGLVELLCEVCSHVFTVSGFLRRNCIYSFSEFNVVLSLCQAQGMCCVPQVREHDSMKGTLGQEPLGLAWESGGQYWEDRMAQDYLENSVHFLAGTACQYVFVC